MKPPISLSTFIGNARIVEILKRAFRQNRLPHAMIFAGPEGVGKCSLALLMAQYVNCLSPGDSGACGACSACKRIMAVIECRHLECESAKAEGFCGTCPTCRLRTRRHPDIQLIEPIKTTISIDQVRELIRETAFQPLEARYRVIILDPAEQMRPEAHNSLLKTLEEPPSRTIIILVTTNPYILLETIRSRSRLLQFGAIPQAQIERYLMVHEGKGAEEARLAAVFSGGCLAAALAFDTEEYRDIRNQALRFVDLLLNRGRFAEASAAISKSAKDKQSFLIWIESVTALLEDIYYFCVAPQRVGQRDLIPHYEELARSVSRSTLVSAFAAIGKLKSDLHYNVNRQLALEAMFLSLSAGVHNYGDVCAERGGLGC
jgi:DNA polymerase-3 subunit delta'